MTVQTIGACRLSALMRAERLSELDTSWLLFGPEPEEAEPAIEIPSHFRIAAE